MVVEHLLENVDITTLKFLTAMTLEVLMPREPSNFLEVMILRNETAFESGGSNKAERALSASSNAN
jgi:hypothetical protein